ncbi:MAG: T9SS type A sorting domain-containing protein [Bacteroidota bacterium]
MKKTGAFIIFMFSVTLVKGQTNLVPNPSFENINSCDSVWLGPCFNQVPYWNCPAGGSSVELYNACSTNSGVSVPSNVSGFQYAHGGTGYIGFVTYSSFSTNYREFVQVRLDSTLMTNRKYCVNFYVSLADSMAYAANSMGMYISDSTVNYPATFFTLNPPIISSSIIADSANWTLISGEFIAHGGEQYIIIGNFHTDAFTSHIIYNSSGLNHYPAAYYYVDDVSLVDCTNDGVEEIGKGNINISPNPATNQFTIENSQLRINSIHIYNVLGEEVQSLKLESSKLAVDLSSLANGVYFVEIDSEKGIVRKKLVKQ